MRFQSSSRNLNSEGPGSLRAALDAKGPRIVVFEVAGVIDLNLKPLVIAEPFVTVAGQPAPMTSGEINLLKENPSWPRAWWRCRRRTQSPT